MRQILPAIVIVIVLCFAAQTFVGEMRLNAANEERACRLRAANAAAVEAVRAARAAAPASRPATRPVTSEESMEFEERPAP